MEAKEKRITLNAKDLTIGYGKKIVAKDINLSLKAGELSAIVGINGIGKSTLLRTLGNLQPLIDGVIDIDGNSLTTYQPDQLATKISIVLTEPLIANNLTVFELIALGRQPYTNWWGTLRQRDTDKIKDTLHILDLINLKNKKCYELSDGQLQRVLLARALAQDTPIILLDEPTTHLDLYHKVHIFKLLKTIAHEMEKTIVLTTHEIEMAIQLCDNIVLLEGDKNTSGEPCELIAQHAFDTLFPSDTVSFDATTGTFKIEK
ncbi:ABC transporter ATP-binding protein [Pareuzebyella sediminis]|uniref:ABC transporter ATP-binding protein n=1 Tax=Pareuzebyella sediminis TaxID=2607998 RepID=UPI0011EC9813|nr:ABC transporter ATP-binding protein [Pareuzebyella sediminis]